MPDFVSNSIVAAVTVGLGAVALWTWQRRYWEYQLLRQTQDWKHRQTYARKDSQRVAMETLLTDMNRALEEFITAALLTASSAVRLGRADSESVNAFNASERSWLVQSRVLLGQLGLYFRQDAADAGEQWQRIIEKSEQTCSLLNASDVRPVWQAMDELRDRKRALLGDLQAGIDEFVGEELSIAI